MIYSADEIEINSEDENHSCDLKKSIVNKVICRYNKLCKTNHIC